MQNLSRKLKLKELIEVFQDQKVITSLYTTSNFKHLFNLKDGDVQLITINNPKSMNSVDYNTINELFSIKIIDSMLHKDNILPIYIGNQDCTVFSSGCDLRYFYEQKDNLENFWKYQNLMYYLVFVNYVNYVKENKNSIYIWNGITTGIGLALGIHSKFKIATESTILSMPEAYFGHFTNCLFNDFIKNFVNEKEALYMSLFTHKFKGYEVYQNTFATHFVLNKNLKSMIGDIMNINNVYNNNIELTRCINYYHNISIKEINDQKLHYEIEINKLRDFINSLFNFNYTCQNFEEFNETLKEKIEFLKNNKEVSIETTFLDDYNSRSLLTNKMNYDITLSSFNKELTFDDRFNLDYDTTELSIKIGNVFEGIRAYFIEKDKKPNWKINNYEELKNLYKL